MWYVKSMVFRWRKDDHNKGSIEHDPRSGRVVSTELRSLRAAVLSLRADLEAEVARRASDEAEASDRVTAALTDLAESVRANDERHDADVQSVSDAFAAQLTLVQTAQAADGTEWRAAFDGLAHELATQTDEHQAEQVERDAALRVLSERIRATADDAATALRTAAAEQTRATDTLRTDLAAAITARADGLAAGIEAATAAQTAALRDQSAKLAARIDEAVRAGAEHHEALNATVSAHEELAATVATNEAAASERIAAALETVEALQVAVVGATTRIDAAVTASSRIDEVVRSLADIRTRLSAAELALQQHDRTDIDLQLDRMESFERHLAEADPDLFAARTELDEVRSRLLQVEEHVRAAAGV
jgi:hypothetical protein